MQRRIVRLFGFKYGRKSGFGFRFGRVEVALEAEVCVAVESGGQRRLCYSNICARLKAYHEMNKNTRM